MKSALIRVLFIICFISGVCVPLTAGSVVPEPSAAEVVAGGEYTYEKYYIDGVWYVFVFDEQGMLQEIFPDSCSNSHGGH